MNRRYVPLIAVSLAFITASALGQAESQTPPDQSVPPTIELTVRPAPEPQFALKTRLLPTMAERQPGNAAPYYYRALLHQTQLQSDYWKQYDENYEAWLAATPDKFPKAEVARWLAGQAHVLGALKTAVYREHCDWDLRLQDLRGAETISYLLHEFQEMRRLGRTLQLKARFEISEGRPDDALETLRMGYQLARDSARPPLLINGLIGIAITNTMNVELERLLETSDTNLYWALASLPDPLIDLRPAMEFEMDLPMRMYPFLQNPETADRSPEEWRKQVVACFESVQELGGSPNDAMKGWKMDLAAVAIVAKLYPAAKQQLLAEGMDAQRLEAMSVGQVVAIQTSRSLQRSYQELFKLTYLPHAEAQRRMASTIGQLKKEGYIQSPLSGREGIPLASLLLPALESVNTAVMRLETRMAGLRAIEALRMHAATNGGKLPSLLSDVTVVPVPDNPTTGKRFAYAYDKEREQATLDVPSPSSSLRDQRDSRRYIIRIQKTVKK